MSRGRGRWSRILGRETGDGGRETGEPQTGLRDGNEHLEMVVPRLGRLLTVIGRAVSLRCPACGGGPVRESWFRMRPKCGRCGLRLERGEEDYFIGGMLFNLVLSELLFATVFSVVLVVMWPTVPWDGIQIGAPIGMALAPFLLYPVSKLLWLAVDLAFRPDREQ